MSSEMSRKVSDFPERGPRPQSSIRPTSWLCGKTRRLGFCGSLFSDRLLLPFLGTSDTSEVLLGLKKPVGFLLSWPVGEQFKRHSRDSISGSRRSFPFYFLPSLIWCTSLHVNWLNCSTCQQWPKRLVSAFQNKIHSLSLHLAKMATIITQSLPYEGCSSVLKKLWLRVGEKR